MLAKETGISVLLVNVGYDSYKMWTHLRQLYMDVRWTAETRQLISRISCSLLFIVIFCSARIAIGGPLPKFSQQDNPAAYHPSIVTRFLTFSYLAAFNWWLMLCPTTLSHDWQVRMPLRLKFYFESLDNNHKYVSSSVSCNTQMSSIPLITAWSDGRNLLTVLIVGLLVGLVYRSLGDFKVNIT